MTPEIIYRHEEIDFFDMPVIAVMAPGREGAISFDDAIRVLKPESFSPNTIESYRGRWAYPVSIQVNERIMQIEVINKPTILRLVLDCNTPRAARFKEWAIQVLLKVQEQGYYIAPNAPVKAVPKTQEDYDVSDPDMAQLQVMKSVLGQLETVLKGQKEIKKTADRALELATGGPEFCSVGTWLKFKKIDAMESVVRQAGIDLSRICRDRGILMGPKDLHGSHVVNRYPIWLLEEWTPSFLKRQGKAS